jgi:hypothetical protein
MFFSIILWTQYFLDYLSNTPFVIVVHDMIHEIFPEYFGTNDATLANKKILIERATRINYKFALYQK